MRVKKQRRHRKSVRFYTACCGFRAPFKVLCDGTFVHNLVVNGVTSPDQAISNILGAQVKLFTTRCVLEELRRLGKTYSDSLVAARNLTTARCDHDGNKKADSCILEIIRENNPEHFFVATQDTDLRRKLQEIPSVPVLFGLRNALFLEQPSAIQRQYVKASEEEHLHMTEMERKRLKKITTKILTSAEANDSDEKDDLEDEERERTILKKIEAARKGNDVKDRPQFKRKKPKGPNPLSCLKKKTRESAKNASQKESKDGGEGSVRSRNRKRKRNRGTNKSSETDKQ